MGTAYGYVSEEDENLEESAKEKMKNIIKIMSQQKKNIFLIKLSCNNIYILQY